MHSTNLQGDIVNIDFTTRGLAKGHTFSPGLYDLLLVCSAHSGPFFLLVSLQPISHAA